MADFKIAFDKTMANEGGYSFDPDDVGGETYKGISRRYNPGWQGWKLIDELKKECPNKKDLLPFLDGTELLIGHVKNFYRTEYWNRFWGDKIPRQIIADRLFDIAVNLGVRRAVCFLQEALNLLNRRGRLYGDIIEDGVFGKNTMAALESYLVNDEAHFVLKIVGILQGMHYIEFMKKYPVQEKFARGWLKRVIID